MSPAGCWPRRCCTLGFSSSFKSDGVPKQKANSSRGRGEPGKPRLRSGSGASQEEPNAPTTNPREARGELGSATTSTGAPGVGFQDPPPQFRSDCRLGMSQKLRAKPRGRRCLQREGSARGQRGDSPAAGAVPPGHHPGSPCHLGMARRHEAGGRLCHNPVGAGRRPRFGLYGPSPEPDDTGNATRGHTRAAVTMPHRKPPSASEDSGFRFRASSGS